MMDQTKLDRIKLLIQTSSILTAQEKTDWLALTQLMNDKQLAELEEILKLPPSGNSSVPISSVGSVATSRPPAAMSHISNMPSQLSHQRSSPISGKTVTPAPRPTPSTGTRLTPMAQQASVKAEQPEKVVRSSSLGTSGRIRPMGRDDDNTRTTVSGLQDVSAVAADVLSDPYRKGFYQTLVNLVSEHGYFQVLSRLEESPLYHDYLEYGQQKLSGRTSATLPLSQEEFEFMADLLAALKINRV